MAWLRTAIFTLLGLQAASAAPVDCIRDWEKIGCFAEHSAQRSRVLFNDEQHFQLRLTDFFNYLRGFACSCAEAARFTGYTYMALRNSSVCVGLNDVTEQTSSLCMDGNMAACIDQDRDDCVGESRAEYIYKIAAPQDGAWTNFQPAGECSVTCGSGKQLWRRTCTNPEPRFGGRKCTGPEEESRDCTLSACPVNGGYTPFSAWSTCSKICGGGVQSRSRTCTNPPPSNGGKGCQGLGEASETQPCNAQPCPVAGGYTAFSDWSSCTASCGGGSRSRSRACSQPTPQYGGLGCERFGPATEVEQCNTQPCPQWPEWPSDFAWTHAGPIPGWTCVQILEAADPNTWGDNYFCVRIRPGYKDPGMRWSSAGPIWGMRCTQILETSDPHTWADNYMCVPHDAPYQFSWSSVVPIPGTHCIRWVEPSDPHTWNDNHLCAQQFCNAPVCQARWPRWPQDFAWSSSGEIYGWNCVRIYEASDPHTWADNYFCSVPRPGWHHPGFRWSSAGPISGMRCTQTFEYSDPHTWLDNYICVPHDSPYQLVWSSAGPINGPRCIQWLEAADPNTWADNYLCAPQLE